MNEHRRSKNIRLGIFVAAGALILFAALFYMGQKWSMLGNSVPVSAFFYDVKGLQVGNNVQFMGITVGTVKKISILSPTAIRVDMAVDQKTSEFIKADAIAQIGTEGLMGNIIVKITPVSETAASLKPGGIIRTKPGVAVDSLLQSLQVTNEHTQVLAQNLAKISEQVLQGNGTVGNLLMDTAMALRLSETIDYLRATSAHSSSLMANLNQMAYQLNKGRGPLGMMLTDTAVNSELRHTISQIKMTSEQSAQLSAELLEVARQLNQGKGMAQTLLKDTVFSNNVEQSLVEIRQGTARFNENMEALQHNFLLRGFFRKKAKKEALEAAKPEQQQTEVSQLQ